jgi:hypothetical protein
MIPYNFQRSYLAAIFDPLKGPLTVRARKAMSEDVSKFHLYTPKDQ